MSKKAKEEKVVELTEARAIVSLPASAVMADVKCKLLDEKKEPYSASKVLSTDDLWVAFRKADEGYWWNEEKEEPHAVIEEVGDALAMICFPENAVFAEIICKCFDNKTGDLIEVRKVYPMVELRKAFQYAETGYIDEDDTFVLTDKGREFVDELLAEKSKHEESQITLEDILE